MAAQLAGALLDTARDFLTIATAGTPAPAPAPAPAPPLVLSQEIQARIEAARDETLEYHRTHRPPNTVRNYGPKQREWRTWCAAQGFPPGGQYLPGDWVDEGKLLLFIKEEVASRPPRKGTRLADEKKRKAANKGSGLGPAPKRQKGKGGARGDAGSSGPSHLIVEGEDDDEQSDLVLMYNTVRGYVSAVKELWSFQTSQGLHNAPQPNRVALKALEQSIIRGEHVRRREEFTDRGISTFRDGYLPSQIPDLHRQVWSESLGRGVVEQALRTQVDFLLGNSMLLRLSNRLPMELADLFLMPLPKEGPSGDGWCLVAVMDQGKTNQHGRLEYGAVLRHRNYQSCPVGALAAYLFWRWHLSGEPFPCFRASQDWYAIKLLKRDNSNLNKQLSDSTANSWTRRLYSLSGIKGSKVSHMPRSSGARIAEANNVSEAQIRRGGRWNSDQMTGCYLTDLPRQFMRGMADFEPDYASSYFIPRDTIRPPPSLRRQVWPQLDRWRQAHLDLPGASEVVEPNLAAGGFLELLDKLRDVFLQDSVFVRQKHPRHPIFRDALFATAEYATFATAVEAAADTLRHEDPHLVAIQKAIPSVNERLRAISSIVQTGQAAQAVSLAQLTSSVNRLASKLDDFLTGSFSLQFTPGRSRMLPQGYDLARGERRQCTPPPPPNLNVRQPAIIDLGGPLPPAPTALGVPGPGPAPAPAPARHDPVPSYRLSRQVATVPDLWREWTVGLGGLPSVAALDAAYGSRWRAQSERQYYSMRKVIIDEIVAIAGSPEDLDGIAAAVETLEQRRVRGRASLDKLIKQIKEERKRPRCS
jgi:hypothetical protein